MLIKSLIKLTAKAMALIAALGGFTLFAEDWARAEVKDFSMCDGLSSQARGLCRGGVAAGCADGTGNAAACASIEGHLTDLGVTPPWKEPPPPCPCDYSIIPKTLDGPWETINGIQLNCGGSAGSNLHTMVLTDHMATTGLYTMLGARVDFNFLPFCAITDEPSNTDVNISVSNDERDSCAQAALNYARELDTLFPGVIDTSGCVEF